MTVSKLYKLTDKNGYTRRGKSRETRWAPGFELRASGKGDLGKAGFVQAYEHPLVAVLLNPVHANIRNPLLWKAEGYVVRRDNGRKVGCTWLRTNRVIPTPEITMEQRIKFAILVAKKVDSNLSWDRWADEWLYNADRRQLAETGMRSTAMQGEQASKWATYAAAAAARGNVKNAAHAAATAVLWATDDEELPLPALAEQACQ